MQPQELYHRDSAHLVIKYARMIPLKLTVQNFLCYRGALPPLDFEGIHVATLCGANGHGKSALLDALTWCLWGNARTGPRNHDSLITHGESECRVELDFEVRGQAHRVIRRRVARGRRAGRTELDLFVLEGDDVRAITGNVISETQALIQHLVGMDYDTFVNTAFLLQGRSDEFTRKNASERKDVLSSILGLELYERLQELAAEKRSAGQRTLDGKKGELAQAKSQLAALPDPTDELAQSERELEQLAAQITAATAEAEQCSAAVEQLRAQNAAATVATQRIQTLQEELRQAEATLSAIGRRIAEARKYADRADAIRDGAAQLAAARAELDRLESVRREHDRLQSDRNGLQAAIDQARATLSADADALERRLTRDLEPLAGQSALIEQELARIAQAEIALDGRRKALDAQDAELAVCSAEIATGQHELQRCVAEGKELRTKQQEMAAAVGDDAVCPLCRIPLTEDACDNITDWYEAEIDAKLRRHASIKTDVARLSERQEALSAQVQAGRTELTNREREAQRQRGQLEQQGRQSADAAAQLASLQPQLADRRRALAAESFAAEDRAALAEVAGQIAALRYDEAGRERAYESVQALQHWDVELRELESALARLSDDEAELARQQERNDRWVAERAETEQRLAELRAELAALPELEEAAAAATAALADRSGRRDRLLPRVGQLQGELKRRRDLVGQVATLETEVAEAQAEWGIYQALRNAFGRQGVPALLIDAAVPQIENEANLLLGRMTDHRLAVKLETLRRSQADSQVETLEILVSDEMGARNYELFSGGEAFRINLALRIALSKVLARRQGAPLPVLFIDEGFGTQDAAGRERIVDTISSIQDDFQKIIVITHLEDLKDQFPARIEVEKTEAGSQFWLS